MNDRVPLAWLNLTHDRMRMALFAAGIGFAVLLMFVQYGCYNALLDSSVLLHQKLNADLFLISRLQTTLILRNTFPRDYLAQTRAVHGVESTYPLYLEYARSLFRSTEMLSRRQQAQTIRVIGVDPDAYLLKFPVLDPNSPQSCVPELHLEGRALFDEGSKAGDWPGSSVYGPVKVGTETDLAGQHIRVIGLFKLGADFGTDGTLIVSDETFAQILRSGPPVQGLEQVDIGLIRLKPGADPAEVKCRIGRLLKDSGVEVVTREDFMEREKRFWRTNTPMGAVFGFGMLMGFLVGVVICVQILSTDVRDNLPAYATLRAVGYSGGFLTRVVLEEALILAGLGFVPGMAVSWVVYEVLSQQTDLPMEMTVGRAALVLVMTVAMCVGSGLWVVREALQADPAEVF